MLKINHIRRVTDDQFDTENSYIEISVVGNYIHVTTTSSRDGARDFGEFEFTLNKDLMRKLTFAIDQTLGEM